MKTINNKTQNSLFQLQAVLIANGINNGGSVTSQLNDIKKSLNTKKFSLGSIWFSFQYEDNDHILSLSSAKLSKKVQKKDTPISKILKIYRPDLNHDLHEHKFNLGAVA
ncbi:hypothetical protein [Sulfurimonas sp.]|uniref:hypothetical protein n=1 Tax=Sulfurimonas sp. TaxID=2022749 RepID=UPI0019FE7E65|nr:hypothetical protein [Sulfurimonas sp.]MBE0515517.1 hypothetical protein [Sulfurimonas sp.]